jgi:hypothetical protein
MATIRRAGWAAGLLTALALAAGCGGPATGEVTGTVTVDGKTPPEGSSITLIPTDGKSRTVGDQNFIDGKYTVRDVPVGTYKVEIRVPRPVTRPKAAKEGPGAEGDQIEESLPDKYNNQSELRLDVHSGKNEKDWPLKTKGGA